MGGGRCANDPGRLDSGVGATAHNISEFGHGLQLNVLAVVGYRIEPDLADAAGRTVFFWGAVKGRGREGRGCERF